MTGRGLEPDAGGDPGKDDEHLRHGQAVTDALAGPGAEGQVGAVREGPGTVGQPAVRVEPRRVGVQLGIVMHPVRAVDEIGTRSADQVVLAAGAWGTAELLHRSRVIGALPELSPALGTRTGTNGELILAATAKTFDAGGGVAISSACHPDATTTIQLCRAGRGPHPLAAGRGRRTAFLNTMTRTDPTLTSYYRRRLHLRGSARPHDDHAAAEVFAQHIGGRVHRVWAMLARMPLTAHLLGGCPLGIDPATSVADCQHRVHGYPTLHIADASVIPHNLGVNPALTITAMAERACAAWPPAGSRERGAAR